MSAELQEITDKVMHQATTIELLRAERDAWRKACRFFYDTVGEGGPKGRPLDCFDRQTWRRIVELIARADELEAKTASHMGDSASIKSLKDLLIRYSSDVGDR